MKTGLYARLAFDGIRKNKRLYLPYILTCVGMVAVYYIILYLQTSETVLSLPAAEIVSIVLMLGSWVIAIFSCIFLFYTHSFLIRRRKREFGLYNVLGMGKRNIGRILLWETVILYCISLAAGLFCGIALSKFSEMAMVRALQGVNNFRLYVAPSGIFKAMAVFGVIFVLLLLNSLRQVRFSSATALLKSENAGERPPKGNWLIGAFGLIILAAAYFIAVKIRNPVTALTVFFIAVIMVIVGTYMVMISGSVALCRILQKRKNYYYRPNHFVSVASMRYRMKRNGAGLASICILATMVLVIASSTTSLYFGGEDSIAVRYPREMNITFGLQDVSRLSDENIGALSDKLRAFAEERGAEMSNAVNYRCVEVAGIINGSTVETDVAALNGFSGGSIFGLWEFCFVPLADYNSLTGSDETLGDGEALIYTYRDEYDMETISFNGGQTFRIKKRVDDFLLNGGSAVSIVPTMVIVTADLADGISGLDRLTDFNGDPMLDYSWICDFDTGLGAAEHNEIAVDFMHVASETGMEEDGVLSCRAEDREWNRAEMYSMNGGFLCLGVMLSVVFISAAVLIIYYKQISEGYEDQSRFEIMKKVGMTGREIRRSINSQLRTVFFFPLGLAACHIAFAFPIIRELLLLFNLQNPSLFIVTTVASVAVFALFYALVYRITSNSYYRIVNGGRRN